MSSQSLFILPDRLTLTIPGRGHFVDLRPGGHLVNADRDPPVTTWACMPTDVGAGTVQLPEGAETLSGNFLGGVRKCIPKGGLAL